MMRAGDVAGAAGAGADAGRGLDHRAHYLRVLAHAEIIVRAPDHDVALTLRRVPERMREPAGNALEIGEHAVAPLGVETIKGGIEELGVIHRQTCSGTDQRPAYPYSFSSSNVYALSHIWTCGAFGQNALSCDLKLDPDQVRARCNVALHHCAQANCAPRSPDGRARRTCAHVRRHRSAAGSARVGRPDRRKSRRSRRPTIDAAEAHPWKKHRTAAANCPRRRLAVRSARLPSELRFPDRACRD